MQCLVISFEAWVLLMATTITELSGKVIVIQSDWVRVLNEEAIAKVNQQFEVHGFKVIWLSS